MRLNAETFGRALSLASARGISDQYPAEVLAEVEQWLKTPGIDDPSLRDLTHLPFVTIDNEGSRDLDQALYLERADDGDHVYYALADASYYVRPGSALFSEALRRGASYYLPGYAFPMLPRALSEGLISLGPQVPRRSLVLQMILDPGGHCVGTQLYRARILSRAQLTYPGVQACYDNGSGQEAPWAASLALLREVGERRIALAQAKGVPQHRREDYDLDVDDRGDWIPVRRQRLEVERYNEQLSLLCNIEGARLLRADPSPHLQPIYRVHEPPPSPRLAAFEALVQATLNVHALDDWHRDDEPVGRWLDRLPASGPAQYVGTALQRQAILINQRSHFAAQAALHYGVGAEEYARFSAPMREIVGIYTHKEALEHLGTPAPDTEDVALRDQVIVAANQARERQSQLWKEAERMVLERVLAPELLLKEKPTHTATILGLSPTKVYVALDQPPLELKLYTDDLTRQWGPLSLSAGGAALGTAEHLLRLGDRLELKISALDPIKRRWSFQVLRIT